MTKGQEAAAVIVVLVLGLALKLALLWTSQRVADADEAILGLMAVHVLRSGTRPLFFYGQTYDIGSGLLARIAARIFAVTGTSGIALKCLALAVWLLTAAAVGTVVRRWFGPRAGWLGLALMMFCPSAVEWGTKARGGYMLAALATVAAVGLGGDLVTAGAARPARSRLLTASLFGFAAASAVWFQPSTLPAVAAATLVVAALLGLRRDGAALGALSVAAAAASIPGLVSLSAEATWSWRQFIGQSARLDLGLLFGKVLPGLFTPELDWAIPPAPFWVAAVAWGWLVTFAASMVVIASAIGRSGRHSGARSRLFLLLSAAAGAATAMLMIDRDYVSPRVLLPLYPLACMVMAAATACASRVRLGAALAALSAAAIMSGGIAVHAASIGPPTLHGAGEQERRLPGDVVAQMVADLDRHGVRHVFSESPTIPWNLMFESDERIAARWVAARDRWQPYVERVNQAFLAGEPCALLLRVGGRPERLANVRRLFAGQAGRLSVFYDHYVLLYDPPREVVESVFARDGGWPSR